MILVTGGTGIVGSQIIKLLHNKGRPVRAIKRTGSDTSWTKEINNHIDWVNAVVGVTHVVHCAAIVSFDNSNDSQMTTVNVEGTKNLLSLCQKYNVKKIAYISSVAALGRSERAKTVTENVKWELSNLNTAYAESKYLAELEVWRAQEEGLSTVILNPSVIIGPGNWSSSSFKLFKHVKNESPLYPVGSLNYVDVRDVADITYQLLYSKIQGERFILNAGLISYYSFFKLIAKGLNKKAPYLKISPTLAIFAAYVLRIIRFITGIKFSITKEAVKLSKLSILFSSNKIEKALGFEFIPVEDSIKWTCNQLENKQTNP